MNPKKLWNYNNVCSTNVYLIRLKNSTPYGPYLEESLCGPFGGKEMIRSSTTSGMRPSYGKSCGKGWLTTSTWVLLSKPSQYYLSSLKTFNNDYYMQQTDLSSVDIRVNVELNLDFFLKIPIIVDRKFCQGRRFHIQWQNLKSSVQVP